VIEVLVELDKVLKIEYYDRAMMAAVRSTLGALP
jgi:hypothetical protein